MSVNTIPNPSDRSRWLLFRICLRLNELTGGGGGGSGDVVGPAGATDGHIVTFDGATGKLIKDSGIAISAIVTPTIQKKSQAIGSGVDAISVVFPSAFASAPVVVASVSRPAGSDMIFVNIDEASITTTGFTAQLSSTTPDANYKLKWFADVSS